jgi:predicted permease
MFSDLRYRLRAIFTRQAMEDELAVELQLHHDREVDKLVARGLPLPEARRRARLAIGGADQVKEHTRDAWGVGLIDATIQDLGYAVRVLRKAPAFTGAVTLSLALGIGANTAIFTLMDAVMWRQLPVKAPQHLLVAELESGDTLDTGFTYAQFRQFAHASALAEVAGYAPAPINFAAGDAAEPGVRGHLVTGNYFSLLGVEALDGRTISVEDDRIPDGHKVVVISHGFWLRRFAADPDVVGRTVRLSATPFTVIGVAPPGFTGVEVGDAPDLFLPLAMQPTVMPAFENLLDNPTNARPWVQVLARTREHTTAAQAAAALDALFQAHARATGGKKGVAGAPPPRLVLSPAAAVSELRRQFARPLSVLLAMVGVVLLIACANTASLLLARATARRAELALRIALGASRRRVVRQLLVESFMLAALGGVCGILLAHWATPLLVAFISAGRAPIALDLAPNIRILSFTCLITVATGLLFGLAPAWRATRLELTPALRGLRGAVARSLQPGRVLAITQIALSVVLLIGAMLFVRSLQQLGGDGAGPTPAQVVMLRVEPRGSDQRNVPGTSERLDRVYRELLGRVEQMPGVRSASMAQITPTAATPGAGAVVRSRAGDDVRVPLVMVYPNYFSTVGIPLVAGRDFTAADLATDAPAVCIVNEAFVALTAGRANPIGTPCMTGTRPASPGSAATAPEPYQVVGVVKDSAYHNPRGDLRPLIYTTFLQTSTGRGQMVLHVRATSGVGDVAQRIREHVVAVDPTMPMWAVQTLETEMNAALADHRVVALLSSLFGALALVLACVGLHGLLAFTMVQRRGEIGLRMALGARRGDVVRMLLKEALSLVALGVAVGVPAALAAARLAGNRIDGLLFRAQATDPGIIAGAVLTLLAVAALAVYAPARQAARVDPMLVLRAE